MQTESELIEILEAGTLDNWVDPLEFLHDDPTFGRATSPLSLISDREGGKNRPVFETETELAIIRGQSRLLFDSTPVAQCAVENLTNYTIGTGFAYEIKKKRETSEPPTGLVEAAQDFIDELLEDQNWYNDREREYIRRDRRDGEAIVALFPQRDGMPVMRFAEPEALTEPKGNINALDEEYGDGSPQSWTFGIHTPESDVETVLGYFMQWNASGLDWDYMPESLIVHSRRNVDRNIKRGVSDFYVVKGDMEGELKLRRNSRVGAALQAAIAWVEEQAPNVTKAQVDGVQTSNATGLRQERTSTGGTRERNVQNLKAGSILKVQYGKKYLPGPLGAGTNNANLMLIAQYVLRSIGIRWNMPEYMISGDSSNANYASTLVAESPFVKARQHDQHCYMKQFREMLWKALKIAFNAGMFRRFALSWTEFKSLLLVDITGPAVDSRDPKVQADKADIELKNGTVSRRTVATEAGRDFDVEQQNRLEDGDDAALAEPSAGGGGFGMENAEDPDEFGGEMQTGRRQFTNNMKAIKDVLAEVSAGDVSETFAAELLVGHGVRRKRAMALIADATGDEPMTSETVQESEVDDFVDRVVLAVGARERESWRTYP